MKKDIKVVITDIDQTLFSHNLRKIPDSAIQAFKKMQEKGIKIFLCSGRNKYLIKKIGVLDHIKPDGLITMNGAAVILDDVTIYSYPIPSSVVDSLIKFSKRLKFGLTLIEEDAGHINYVDEHVISAHEKYGTRFPQPRSFPDHYDRVVYQAICFCDELDESLFLPHIKEAKAARWDEYAVDIMPKESDKSKGVHALLEHLNLDPENVLAIGDGNNDIEILQYAGIGVAMGNAGENVKKSANYVTDSVDNDGWANAMKHFELI